MAARSGRILLLAAFTGLALVAALAVRSRLERDHRRTMAAASAADSAFADSVLRAAEDMGVTVTVRASTLPPPVRDAARITDLLSYRLAPTYLGSILAARDSALYRWPERRVEPVSVWIQAPELPGFDAMFQGVVQGAFREWFETGVPVEFRFIFDSARADVHVTWVDRYESRTSGRTRWARDEHGWILGGGIELALHQPDGRALESRAVRAIALHEVGHLLGLDHSPDQRDIMAADVRVSELSEADHLTVRLLYDLPPGSLRTP